MYIYVHTYIHIYVYNIYAYTYIDMDIHIHITYIHTYAYSYTYTYTYTIVDTGIDLHVDVDIDIDTQPLIVRSCIRRSLACSVLALRLDVYYFLACFVAYGLPHPSLLLYRWLCLWVVGGCSVALAVQWFANSSTHTLHYIHGNILQHIVTRCNTWIPSTNSLDTSTRSTPRHAARRR